MLVISAPARARSFGPPDPVAGADRLAGAPRAGGARLSDRGESAPATAVGWAAVAVNRWRPATTLGTSVPGGPSGVAGNRHNCDGGYAAAVASATHRAEMDVRHAARSSERTGRDPPARDPDGEGESHLGLHADSGCTEECRASSGPIDHRPDPQSPRSTARPGPADLVADLSPGALGRDRRRGLLHDRGVDLARLSDLLHGVCDRPRLTPCADPRLDAASQRSLHAAGRSHADGRLGPAAARHPRADLRSGSEVEWGGATAVG